MLAGKMMMTPLLTTPEVARLLHLSVRTVYASSHRLGGFYPAGIRALRFQREIIYAIMAGPQDRKIPLPVPGPGASATAGPASNSKAKARTAMELHRASLTRDQEPPVALTPLTPSFETPFASDSGTSLNLEALMVKYLRVAERSLAEVSLKKRKAAFRRFLDHVGNVPVGTITPDLIEDYLSDPRHQQPV